MYSASRDVYAKLWQGGGSSARVATNLCQFAMRAGAGFVSKRQEVEP